VTLSGYKHNNKFYHFSLHNQGCCPAYVIKRVLNTRSNHSAVNGSGIGLLICKKIVEAYKGKIKITSSSEEGTTIDFTLPIYHAHK
jgi:two-component system, sporulation sensor kinase D